jgi:hypothetical protein
LHPLRNAATAAGCGESWSAKGKTDIQPGRQIEALQLKDPAEIDRLRAPRSAQGL